MSRSPRTVPGMKTGHDTNSSAGTRWIRDRFVQAVYAELRLGRSVVTAVIDDLTSEPRDRVAAEVTAVLEDAVASQWDKGWQPADLVHAVAAKLGQAPADLLARAVASQACTYADLGRRVASRWMAQVDDLDVVADGPSYLWEVVGDPARALMLAIKVHGAMLALPPLPVLTDPPSKWSEHGPVDDGSLPSGILTKVRALLAKAESTTFDAEAEALTAKAQELMTRYRVDRALLDNEQRGPHRPEPVSRRILIDSPYADAKATLLSTVGDPNGCRTVWAKPFRHCTVIGFPDELDAVEELFTSLLVQAEHALIREGSKQDRYGRSRTKQFRRSFLVAFAPPDRPAPPPDRGPHDPAGGGPDRHGTRPGPRRPQGSDRGRGRPDLPEARDLPAVGHRRRGLAGRHQVRGPGQPHGQPPPPPHVNVAVQSITYISDTLDHMSTRNLTLSMAEDLVRRAKVLAAQRDTSLSGLVAQLLEQALGDSRSDDEVAAEELRLMREGAGYRVGDATWSRDSLHER
jgi:hypothetical protein